MSSSQAAQFAPLLRGVSLTGTGEQESAQRVRMTMSLKPLLTQQVTAVAYDGSAYVSLDGSRFSAVPSLRGLSGGFGATPNDLTQYLQGLTSVRDLGSTQQDGQTVEHLQATLDQSVLQKALSQAGAQASGTGAGQPGQLGQLFTQFFQLQGGTVDAYVLPSNGQLDRVDVSMKVAIDFDRLKQVVGGLAGGSATNAGAQIPGGSLGMTVDVGVHYQDYGAAITVHKPTVDPNAPSIPSNGILGG